MNRTKKNFTRTRYKKKKRNTAKLTTVPVLHANIPTTGGRVMENREGNKSFPVHSLGPQPQWRVSICIPSSEKGPPPPPPTPTRRVSNFQSVLRSSFQRKISRPTCIAQRIEMSPNINTLCSNVSHALLLHEQ